MSRGLPEGWRGARHSALDDPATHFDLAARAMPGASVTAIEVTAAATFAAWATDGVLPWTGRVASEQGDG